MVETLPVVVVKRDGSRELFDRGKLMGGMVRACQKRPVPMQTLENVANDIETTIQNSLAREVSTEQIGEYVMLALKDIDEVAYVRFASVYRQFTDVSSFQAEISKLIEK
jgi:transcriptional repressor NrdR